MSMRLRVGLGCWFTHDDGRTIEGTYKGRRRVAQITAFKRIEHGFEEEVVTWTVPKRISIHPGQKGTQ